MTAAPPTQDPPLATYAERLLEVRRDFALYPDRVVVTARWLHKGSFRHVVPLERLAPEPRPLLIRYRMYRYAGWVLAAGSLAYAVLYYRAEGAPLGVKGPIALTVAVAGALVLALTYPLRRLEFARFVTREGKPGLDVGAGGGDRTAFTAFVAAVSARIRRR